MHRSTSTKGNHGEIARIMTTIDRYKLERVDHIIVGDPQHPAGSVLRAQIQRASKPIKAGPNSLHVSLDLPADKIVRIDTRQHQIGVRCGWLAAALTIGNRPRHRSCALRTDMHLVIIIDPGNRAAAIANLNNVDHWCHNRITSR